MLRIIVAALLVSVAGCTAGTPAGECGGSAECGPGRRCVAAMCVVVTSDAGDPRDAGPAADGGGECEPSCRASEVCVAGACVEDGGPCAAHADCVGDRRCDAALARCVPWGAPPDRTFDATCAVATAPAPDITPRADPMACDSEGAVLATAVCNRGASDAVAGLSVGFYLADPSGGAAPICAATTTLDLAPGACERVSCRWDMAPPDEVPVEIWIAVDDLAAVTECREANNVLVVVRRGCAILV